ncbi:acyclic terpene utilization AtuA family protein [Ideonella sp. A 288]|uniref:acyclic terpene utilization AtuA family protein n=1 Tax=Ideonella sp. A 288 TaxID=1962181 RepID=UPI000B4B3F79|nr:acyclic terpene utilization AtuA family protein [Ideonella sp. A 288]
MTRPVLRIGGASGFWGDSCVGAPQLVHSGLIDVLVFDYLAETTMAILVGAQRKNPSAGYATDFVDSAMAQVLPEVVARGIKVVANAGGVNPRACADALSALAASLGLAVRIAVVEGDDLRPVLPALRAQGLADLFSGAPVPDPLLSANAYLGALPIARALAEGADVVITGRCVDSAVTLGPLIHHFGWSMDDFDRLAGGSLAGHIIECGCQATGGLFTDWDTVPDWAHIGYPIVECAEDGNFVVTKAPGTGGLVSRATVAEQLLYEIGDPGAYLLPDVACDFRQVTIEAIGPDRVQVRGARGSAPPPTLKVSATAMRGWRCTGTLTIVGIDAAAKARRTGDAILQRVGELFAQRGWAPMAASRLEVLGAEASYGPHATARPPREVLLRVAVHHAQREPLELFAREIAPAGTSWSPGTTGAGGGRPPVQPLIAPCSFAVARDAVVPVVQMGHLRLEVPMSATAAPARPPTPLPDPPVAGAVDAHRWVPLVRLAWARSGDKGDLSNIGLIARRPEWLPLLWQQVTPEAVAAWLGHLVKGRVERFHLPGLAAMNLVLHEALDGGGPVSLRLDPLGKAMAQLLLEMPVALTDAVAADLARDAMITAPTRDGAVP